MAAPTRAELIDWVSKRTGVVLADDATLDRIIDSAIDELHRLTGYIPFEAVAGTVKFDPPTKSGMIVRMPNGIVELTSIVVSGAALVEDTDFILEPEGRSIAGKPAEWIRFLRGFVSTPRTMVITATWGYSTTYPAAIFEALLDYAGGKALAMQTVGKIATQGEGWTDGDVSVRNATSQSGGVHGGDGNISGPGSMIKAAELVFGRYARKATVWGF